MPAACVKGASTDTTNLIQDLMNKSKLNAFQKRQLLQDVKGGNVLPLSCHPTSSGPPDLVPESIIKIDYSKYRKKPSRRSYYTRPIIRTQDQIQQNTPEKYKTSVQRNQSVEKTKLQNYMISNGETYKDIKEPEIDFSNHNVEPLDEFDQIMQEIEERHSFLNDMIKLGQGAKYEHQISTEIAQRVSKLEFLQFQRNTTIKRKKITARARREVQTCPYS